MKKILYILAFVFCVSLTITACTEETIMPKYNETEGSGGTTGGSDPTGGGSGTSGGTGSGTGDTTDTDTGNP